MRKVVFVYELFDPMYLKGKETELPTLIYLADNLKYFRYFTFECLFANNQGSIFDRQFRGQKNLSSSLFIVYVWFVVGYFYNVVVLSIMPVALPLAFR